jgi:FtsZ-binding cell division protein ZapB
MNTLERVARERCRWCAEGIERSHTYRGLFVHYDVTRDEDDRDLPCTAPTPEALIEELAQENAALKQSQEDFLRNEVSPLWRVVTEICWTQDPEQLLGLGGEYQRALWEVWQEAQEREKRVKEENATLNDEHKQLSEGLKALDYDIEEWATWTGCALSAIKCLNSTVAAQEETNERLAQALRECRRACENWDSSAKDLREDVIAIVDKALGPQ